MSESVKITATPMRSARLRRIVAAYTINRTGTWFGYVALSVAVFDETHSAIAVAALLVAGQVLSAFPVPALVARIEASPMRGGLTALYLFEAVATVALAALLKSHFSLPAVLVLVALDGTAALAASALLRAAASRTAREWARREHRSLTARGGVPPTSAPDAGAGVAPGERRDGARRPDGGLEASELEAERKANAALNIGFAITFTLGPALAGAVIVPALGAPAALLIDAASFVLCGVMLLDVVPHVEGDTETSSVGARLRAAWGYINCAPTLRLLLIAEGVALVFFTFSGPVEVAYAKVSLNAGTSGYGLLVGVWGLGATIGSVVFARSIKRSLGLMLSVATLAVGLAYLGWAVAPSLVLACCVGLVGGIGNGVQWASFISAVQTLTPLRLRGRMMGAVESIGAICPAAGFTLGGTITAITSPRGAFLVAGVGATLSTATFVRLQRLGIRAPEQIFPEILDGDQIGASSRASASQPEPSDASDAPDAPIVELAPHSEREPRLGGGQPRSARPEAPQ
jgi:Transmembrane secretion effector